MRGAFVGPESEFHHRLQESAARRRRGPGKQFSEIRGLIDAMDGAEHQLDRPLGGHAFGLQGIGQAQATHHQIRALLRTRNSWLSTCWPSLSWVPGRQQRQLLSHQLTIEIGSTHLHQLHAAFAAEKARQGNLELGIRQQEELLTRQRLAMWRQARCPRSTSGSSTSAIRAGATSKAAAAAAIQARLPSTPKG